MVFVIAALLVFYSILFWNAKKFNELAAQKTKA